MEWINQQYHSIGFEPSKFENEDIFILLKDGKKGGLGRLVNFQSSHAELSGILILDNFRGQGLASVLVRYLTDFLIKKEVISWCIPFSNLEGFYAKFGFETIHDWEKNIPKYIKEKLNRVSKTITPNVRLMKHKMLDSSNIKI